MTGKTTGFTLLEVMVSLAIMSAVIITLLGTVNYHLQVIAAERDSTTMTLLARTLMTELGSNPVEGEGSFAPGHPEFAWVVDILPTQTPYMRKLVVKVRRNSDGRGVTLVQYLSK